MVLISVSGCSTDRSVIDIITTPLERQPLNIEEPAPLELLPLEWTLITEENKETVFESLNDKTIDPVLFGLTDIQYEMLSINFSKIREYLLQQRLILQQYKEYYEDDG